MNDGAVAIYNKKNNSFSRLEFELNDLILPVQTVRNIVPIDHERIMVAGSRIIVLKNPWAHLGSGRNTLLLTNKAILLKTYI